jgi:hypothetical protein
MEKDAKSRRGKGKVRPKRSFYFLNFSHAYNFVGSFLVLYLTKGMEPSYHLKKK